MPKYEDPKVRFWRYVDKNGPNGCWIWRGGFHSNGYGQFHESRPVRKGWQAHRYAYATSVEEIPDGKLCCHRCDNRKCVNPGHIFLGTHKDNAQDAVSKGRASFQNPDVTYRSGEDHPAHRFIESDILKIISLKKTGMFNGDIGILFKTSKDHVSQIIRGTIWNTAKVTSARIALGLKESAES